MTMTTTTARERDTVRFGSRHYCRKRREWGRVIAPAENAGAQKCKKPADDLASLQISKSKVNNGSGNAGCPPPEDGPRRTPLAA
ncbi:hypothetical protein, partial [Caballeronia choica]|uniref:hypothetical protein n=1 Tax=Caballeronia choica TaxID=326476 RepID=UPI001F36F25D